jgi:hypothetical protein
VGRKLTQEHSVGCDKGADFLAENQVDRRWQQSCAKAALGASAAFVVQAFSSLSFGYLMIRSLGLIVMVIGGLMMRVISRFLNDRRSRTITVTEHLSDRSHPLQWNCKSKQTHH